MDAAESSLRVFSCQPALLDPAHHVTAIRVLRLAELLVARVMKPHLDAFEGGLLGDLGSHRPSPNHS